MSANSAENENGDQSDVGPVTHEPRNEPGDFMSANSAENEKGDNLMLALQMPVLMMVQIYRKEPAS